MFFFFKQKTAYEMRISDWSSDVCSSDLRAMRRALRHGVEVGPQIAAFAAQYVVDLRDVGVELLAVAGPAHGEPGVAAAHRGLEIGRASCRERVCQAV